MKLNDRLYDILKWLVISVFPAAATLYSLLAVVWGWPYADEVATTVTGVNTFLGAVLCISTMSYNKLDVRKEAE